MAVASVKVRAGPTTRAQQAAMPVVGFLSNISPGPIARPLAAFQEGLREAGYMDGQNVKIEYRWAEGRNDRLPELAANLVQRQAAVIVAIGAGVSALAAKTATTTIPIVFSAAADPVELGLVASLNGRAAMRQGFSSWPTRWRQNGWDCCARWSRTRRTIAVMVNPQAPGAESQLLEGQAAARTIARQIVFVKASSEHDLDTIFPTLTTLGADALLVAADPFFNTRRDKIVDLAARHAVPAIMSFASSLLPVA
jgi:putative tryptophan/tyrosine transport system substrate-binding protein